MRIDNDYCSYEQKLKIYYARKQETFNIINQMDINQNTAYRLLRYIDADKIKTKQYILEYLSMYLMNYYKITDTSINLVKKGYVGAVSLDINDVNLYGIIFQKKHI